MNINENILLVEGESDKSFFEQLCKKFDLKTAVKVAHPRELAGTHNSKQGVLNHLPLLLEQLADGRIKHLAIVVDADMKNHGGGYIATIDRIKAIVDPYGFKVIPNSQNGVVFRHNDGLEDLGVWIMPNNADDGMLEDWFKQCVIADELNLLTHANVTLTGLPMPVKFAQHHHSKAQVATWLAWQKNPGHGMYRAVEENLLDANNASFKCFESWIKVMYT